MRRLLLVCATSFLCVAAILAQGDNQQKFKVSGTVVNSATGEPVRGAMIDFQGSDQRSAMAGSDGRFEIDAVAGGNLFVSARRPGFAPPNQWQRVTVGPSMEPVVVKLVPFARISGRVTDREGEPIDGVQLQCMRELIINGRKQWQQTGGGTSDETGNFQIEDLAPGAYIVHTRPNQLYRMMQRKSQASRYIYPATFYPDAASRDMAQRIELAAGQDLKVDMQLQSVRAARVTLTTVPRYPSALGRIMSLEDDMGAGGTRADASGVITFGAVPPGSWQIVVTGNAPGVGNGTEEGAYGELQVDVGTADIENLTVPLGRLLDIPVVSSGVANQQVFVQLFSKSGLIHASGVDQSGEMKIHAVTPGTYRVVARPNGGGCVTSVMSGAQDLLREQLVVSAGSSVAPIQVVQSNNCAGLTITPNTKGTVTVLIISNLQGFEPRQVGAANGSATVDGLSPGDYQVYAFDDVSDLEYANPDAMRDFKGQAVTLEAGQKTSIQVEVNERRPR